MQKKRIGVTRDRMEKVEGEREGKEGEREEEEEEETPLSVQPSPEETLPALILRTHVKNFITHSTCPKAWTPPLFTYLLSSS